MIVRSGEALLLQFVLASALFHQLVSAMFAVQVPEPSWAPNVLVSASHVFVVAAQAIWAKAPMNVAKHAAVFMLILFSPGCRQASVLTRTNRTPFTTLASVLYHLLIKTGTMK
jgi:hypothetical protein